MKFFKRFAIWFNDLSMQGKLLFAMGAILAIMGGTSLWAVLTQDAVASELEDLLGHEAELAVVSAELRGSFLQQHSAWQNVLVRGGNQVFYQRYSKEFDERAENTGKLRARLEGLTQYMTKGEKALIEIADRGYSAYMEAYPRALEAYGGPGGNKQREAEAVISGKDRDPESALSTLAELIISRAQRERSNLEAHAARTKSIVNSLLIVSILIGLGLAVFLARRIVRPLQDVGRVSLAIQSGDLSARAQPTTADELGQLGYTLNDMLDEITALVQTKEERDRIQQQIVTLLEEVSTLADGDLTIQANVHEGALGSVADAFNYMVSELRTIIATVNETTVQVVSSTNEILAASNQLATSATQQAHQIAETSQAVEDLTGSINEVSENARVSAEVAARARSSANQGLESVRATIGGMQRIRNQVQQTAKQVKRLGESSQEIGQIVQLIEEMAEKTDLLALNASIQAAAAGDQGRGFAVVAEEVRRLAERASTAAKQISLLVTTIQADTAQAVVAMEQNTSEVVEGSRLADEAGQSLEAVDEVVQQMAGLAETISRAAERQADVSRRIAHAMTDISGVTESTSAGSREAAESVNHLARLAETLRSSVATFKLSKSEA
jgi:twitching motility protein PilJ